MHGPYVAATQLQEVPSSQRSLLGLGALGVVYGDIGTSPLYTVQAVVAATGNPTVMPGVAIGTISCIIWALILIVTVKYVLVVLRVDNDGEGGVLALASLVASKRGQPRHQVSWLLVLGAVGAALFYGDAVITPAISVLGAVEGLRVVAPTVTHWIVPVTLAILIGLFAIQRFGTTRVGTLFGPIMVMWFIVIGWAGVEQIIRSPQILDALNPVHAASFLASQHWKALAVIGGVALAVTGAEALYADLGHFGARSIRLAWLTVVFPALILNYLGQGALLLSRPDAIESPFFHLFPHQIGSAVLLLATLAAVIASQAVISGAYSMTRQAIQLGLLPRLGFRFTSAHAMGQIYVPTVNSLLLIAVILIVLAFRSSASLASAYGMAVTLTMLITTVLICQLVWASKKPSRLPLLLALSPLAMIDLMLVAGCSTKLLDGAWLPLVAAAVIVAMLVTWAQGRARVLVYESAMGLPIGDFLADSAPFGLHVTERTALFLVSNPQLTPTALLHNIKHNQVLHRHNVLIHVQGHRVPWIAPSQRSQVHDLGKGFWQLTLHFGFMEKLDVPGALSNVVIREIAWNPAKQTWFLSRPVLVIAGQTGTAVWRRRLFVWMSRFSSPAAEHFHLPDEAVIELNAHVTI